jgi:hypothetical protein
MPLPAVVSRAAHVAKWRPRLQRLTHRGLLWLVLAYFVALAAAFAVLVPPFESPDETGHLAYLDFVAARGQLPNQYSPERAVAGEGHQFPLYYVLLALPVRLALADNSVDLRPTPNPASHGATARPGVFPKFVHPDDGLFVSSSDRVAFYGLRACSIACGALTVWLTYLLAAQLGANRSTQLRAAFCVASLPQFAFISASVNNDNLAITLTTLATLLLTRLRAMPAPRRRDWLAFGAALGCALLTKKTALFMLPATLGVCASLALRRGPARRRSVLGATLALLLVAGLAGWVFARNWWLYGDPLGSRMEARTLPELVDHKPLWSNYWPSTFAPRLAESFVGVFGWMDLRLPELAYVVYLALSLASLVGLVVAAPQMRDRWPSAVAAALIASCGAGVVWYNLSYTQYQGRFMFPVLGPIAVLLALGAQALTARVPGQLPRRAMAGVALLALVSIDVVSLLVVRQCYADPRHYR